MKKSLFIRNHDKRNASSRVRGWDTSKELASSGSKQIDILAKVNKLRTIFQNANSTRVLLQHKVAASTEHTHILKELSIGSMNTVVDIGANRGQFALIAKQYFPNARFFSFEPLKESAALFRRVFASDSNITLHEIAIGPDNQEMTFHVSRADDSSSLLPIASLQSKLFPGTDEKEQRKVPVRRLDAVISQEDIHQPALLKIDVQGFEKDVLEGCRTLLPWFSYIYVECSFMELYAGQALAHEIISFLEDCGFILSGIYNLSYDQKGIAIQGDFLFERKNRPA